jgi:uncharacterized protein YutE (UPF0331/DUF86 family)
MMTKARISRRIAADRIGWIEQMLAAIRSLPLEDADSFFADARNSWAAESCLRRALEALLDLGRHILAKAFAIGVSEYKQIADELTKNQVIGAGQGEILRTLAGYRNRMVHFYHEVSKEELHQICTNQLTDIEIILASMKRWIKEHPEYIDETL